MKVMRVLCAAMALLAAMSVSPAVWAADACVDGAEQDLFAATCASQVEVGGNAFANPEDGGLAEPASSEPADRYQRHPICAEWFGDAGSESQLSQEWPGDIPDCVAELIVADTMCPPASSTIDPLWVSRANADGTYGPWQQLTGYECTASPLPAAIAAAWQQMTIDPSTFTLAPDQGWAIASWGVAPSIDESTQQQDVVILGFDVILRATPAEFAWTTDDGTGPTTAPTTDGPAGETITFARREHRAQLSVTTTWNGHYSLDGGATWTPAPGTATTTTTQSLHVFNPRAHLVNCDLDGNCADGNSAPAHPFTVTDPDADGIDNHTIPDADIDAYLATREAGRQWSSSARIG
ncbi:hypothetical protein [uncultured Demequina sp.]|uniref:hypothetical protein n=1 Tax=uncultured Demequina sp. TaxID=693499 RepID=UPI0025E53AD4|nr:hypothetical protein [uncultured Demequina sp.]